MQKSWGESGTIIKLKTIVSALGLGLLVSEAVSFYYIQQSNTMLHEVITALTGSGHIFLVPNRHILQFLSQSMPAVFAAVFIVLTAGVMVSILSIISAVLSSWLIRNRKHALFFYTGFWLMLTILIRDEASSWILPAHTLLIPLIILLILRVNHPVTLQKMGITLLLFFMITLGITGSFIAAKADLSLFSRARDYLLLSNRPGKAVNNFYYSYTLYAAEAVRSPYQKQVKACWINTGIDRLKPLTLILSSHGWLRVNKKKDATLIIEKDGSHDLRLMYKDTLILKTGINAFIKNPRQYLITFSNRTDTNSGFRLLCLAGLVAGGPFLVYFFWFFICFFLIRSMGGMRAAVFITPVVATLGALLLFFQLFPLGMNPGTKQIKRHIHAPDATARIEALRILYRAKKTIWSYPGSVEALINGTAVEKYWLAKNFALKPNPQNIVYLKQLLKDGSVNVQCKAIEALSENRCQKEITGLFRELIFDHRQWYVQLYAYNALRKCP